MTCGFALIFGSLSNVLFPVSILSFGSLFTGMFFPCSCGKTPALSAQIRQRSLEEDKQNSLLKSVKMAETGVLSLVALFLAIGTFEWLTNTPFELVLLSAVAVQSYLATAFGVVFSYRLA